LAQARVLLASQALAMTRKDHRMPTTNTRVAVEYVSVDAGTRTMLRGEGFHRQVGLGETILAGGVGRIVESNIAGWIGIRCGAQRMAG
jgi:NADPH-dependent curcumin reductase CurA